MQKMKWICTIAVFLASFSCKNKAPIATEEIPVLEYTIPVINGISIEKHLIAFANRDEGYGSTSNYKLIASVHKCDSKIFKDVFAFFTLNKNGDIFLNVSFVNGSTLFIRQNFIRSYELNDNLAKLKTRNIEIKKVVNGSLIHWELTIYWSDKTNSNLHETYVIDCGFHGGCGIIDR